MTLEEMKKIKREKGYSLTQISEYSGIPLGTLQKVFSGRTENPRYATRRAIERALLHEDQQGDHPAPSDADSIRAAVKETDAQGGCTCPSAADLAQETGAGQVREESLRYDVSVGKREGKYTLENYYALPDGQRAELIDGVIYKMEAPGFVHQRIVSEVSFQISDYIRKKGGSCMVLTSPLDVRLDCGDRTMVQPDLVILCDRGKARRWGVMGAPDFVLEVASDSTRKKDYTLKVQKYAGACVREYWIIDPMRRALVTYMLSDDYMPHIHSLKDTVGLAVCDGDLKIDLGGVAELIEDWPE